MLGSWPLRRSRTLLALLAAVAMLFTFAVLPRGADAVMAPLGSRGEGLAIDGQTALDDLDRRLGSVAPSAAAKDRVSALGARVEWNRYGTAASLIKDSGYLATGLSSDPVTAARSFISANRALFRLSSTGLDNLEVLNDSKLTGSPAHVVLFRQKFGSLPSAQDGMISVGVVGGKVAYVS